jgi:hypothetical protein
MHFCDKFEAFEKKCKGLKMPPLKKILARTRCTYISTKFLHCSCWKNTKYHSHTACDFQICDFSSRNLCICTMKLLFPLGGDLPLYIETERVSTNELPEASSIQKINISLNTNSTIVKKTPLYKTRTPNFSPVLVISIQYCRFYFSFDMPVAGICTLMYYICT